MPTWACQVRFEQADVSMTSPRQRCTPQARDEIFSIINSLVEHDIYFVPRKNYFMGRWIQHGGWYPDYRQPQLFNKHKMRYTEDPVHHTYELAGLAAYLRGHVIQYPFLDLDQYLQKMNRYSTLMVEQMIQHGRKFRTHQLVTHPIFTFFKMYVLRLGFLDGMPGLILALLYTYYTFVKYAKFWERERASA